MDKRIWIVFVTVFVDLIGFGIIIPLNPYLADRFGASPFEVGLLMSVYSAMQFLVAPIWGQLSDRHGRRPIILLSLLGAALAHLGFALAPDYWGLVVARTFAGAFGANISTAMAYVADITDTKNRSRGMGMVGAAFGIGFVFGPFLGGMLAHVGKMLGEIPPLGESFPALIAALICGLNFLAALKYLPESLKVVAPGYPSAPTRFQRIIRSLKTPVLGSLVFASGLNTLGMATMEASLFLYVQDKFGWGLAKASFGFAYIGLILAFTQGFLVRRMMPKWGERKTLFIGLTISSLAFAGMGLGLGVLSLGVAVTLLGLGSGLVLPALNGSISLTSSETTQGHNMGVSQSLASLARIVGPPIGGLAYQRVSPEAPFWMSVMFVGIALSLLTRVRSGLPESGKA